MPRAGAGFVYLHGFASGPSSNKGRHFRGRFAEIGVPLEVPDLNEPDFESVTVTRMIDAARERIPPDLPAVLIGSSLGAYTAALVAACDPRVAAVVLLAPALDFPARLRDRLAREDPGAADRGSFEVFHFARKENARIRYALVADGLRYEPFPDVRCPALVMHGVRDESVPVELSRRFAAGRANVELVELDDDHQLLASVDRIWAETRRFLAAWLRP